MLAILNSNPIVSREGKPVHGRVYIFQKDTNQLATIYQYDENNSLIETENPAYTDVHGFLEKDVILDDLIYSLVVEEYYGDYSDPKSDERSTMWDIVNNYYIGNLPEEQVETTVYGINGLAYADTSLGQVDVVGYYTSYDCGKRTYVWDPESVETPDGGYVVRSDKYATGRWKLVNDNPWIPSEWYGVYPAKTSNLNNLISVPKTFAGSMPINVPGAIKFATGSYTFPSDITLSNDRDIIIDNETKFDQNHSITCNGLTIMGNVIGESTGKGKFIFPHNAIAYASWFYTFDDFFKCGAGTLYIDKTSGYWYPPENITVTNTVIDFTGHYEVYIYHSAAGRLTLDNCIVRNAVKGKAGFSKNVTFKNMIYSDRFILSGGQANGNGIVDETCSLTLSDFEYAGAYMELLIARMSSTIYSMGAGADLQGRSTGDIQIPLTGDTTFVIENGSVMDVECYDSVKFDNCNIKGTITVKSNPSGAKTLEFNNCTLYNIVYDGGMVCTVKLNNCVVRSRLKAHKIIANNTTFLDGAQPLCYPASGYTAIYAIFNGCVFEGKNRGIYLLPEGSASSFSNTRLQPFYVTNCTFNLSKYSTGFQDDFVYNDVDGVVVDMYLSDVVTRFLAKYTHYHNWEWKNNTGTCLHDNWQGFQTLNHPTTDSSFRFISFGEPEFTGAYNRQDQYIIRFISKTVPFGSEYVGVTNTQNASSIGNGDIYHYDPGVLHGDYFTHKYKNTGTWTGSYYIRIDPALRKVNQN